MESVRESWTDARLDDLNSRVSDGFADTRQEFRAIRGEIAGVREEVGLLRGAIAALGSEFHSMQRTMVYGFVGMTGAIVGGFAAMLTLLAALH